MAEVPLLETCNLRKAFGGVRAVDGVSFQLRRGEVCALIGPNGAGKTTLLNLLTGQLRSDAGLVRLKGERITGLPPERIWRKGIGRTFQVTASFGSLMVLENVQVAMLSHQGRSWDLVSRAEPLLREPALALLGRVGLAGQAEHLCAMLSFGDLKRLELAIALANDPELLILDEPTAGMAPQERMELMALTVGMVRERGVTVYFTEHDMDVVFASAHRIMVMHQGRLVAEGTPQAVRDNREVQAIYLGSPGEPGKDSDGRSCWT